MARTHTLDPQLMQQLPTLPGVAVDLIATCEDPTVGVRDVAAVAQRDPALVARILQVANSPFYAPREPVTDVTRAAAVLGLRGLKMIGVGFAIIGELWSSTTRSEPLAGVIGASAIAGSAARSFSARLGTGRDEEALTAGLLAFVGELGLLRCYPDQMADLWNTLGCLPSRQVAREQLGADAVMVGDLLMERWALPEGLRSGVRVRCRPLAARLAHTPSVYDASLGFGTAIAELMAGGEPTLHRIRSAARAWGFSDEELLGYWSEFRSAARRTSQQLDLDVGPRLDAMIVEAKDEYMASLVHASTELDAARREIAQLKAVNERLEGLSLQDTLTGAPNRPAFVDHLRASLAARQRDPSERTVGVAMFDLDHFKRINDSLGHPAGDRLLQAVAASALGSVRQNELFARIGGDEFAMVLRPDSIDELELAVERVRRAMVDGAVRAGVPGATVSAGAALSQSPQLSSEEAAAALTRAADDALYLAKGQGRNRLVVCSTTATPTN